MDLRNSVEMLRESIDKQSKELAHVSRDTKKLKKLELHRQRDNDARRAGGELEPLHVLRPLPNRPGQVTPAARPTTPDLVAARVASPTSRPTSGGPWDKTAAAWVTTCAELKAKVAHATFGVMTLDWDNVAKRAHMFNTSSPPSMHQLFDDLDTRNVGVLNEEQVRQLLVDDHGFDKVRGLARILRAASPSSRHPSCGSGLSKDHSLTPISPARKWSNPNCSGEHSRPAATGCRAPNPSAGGEASAGCTGTTSWWCGTR